MDTTPLTLEQLRQQQVVLLGLGVNHEYLVQWLVRNGVKPVVRDANPAVKEQFSQKYPEAAEQITWQVGEDIFAKLEQFQVVFRSPSIPYLKPELQRAERKGVRIWSQTKLFLDLCPARVIGVTGTNGKGTTCTLLHGMLEQGYAKGKTYLGGNIGLDPFQFLDELTADDLVILELSSFQLQDLHRSPQVAILLSVTPDHLNHHATLEEYHQAKGQLLAHQTGDDLAVVHAGNEVSRALSAKAKGKVWYYRRHQPQRNSAWSLTTNGEEVVYVQVEDKLESFSITNRKLVGDHNLENILPACLVATYFGVPFSVQQKVVVSFTGLPHRLQVVHEHDGVKFIDDSISTSPATTIAALTSFAGKRIHLILGGSDKGHQFSELAPVAVANSVTISLLPGPASQRMLPLLKKAQRQHPDCILIEHSELPPDFQKVFSGIQPHLQAGDLVLLSPAAASLVGFANYKDRGDKFAAAVAERYV